MTPLITPLLLSLLPSCMQIISATPVPVSKNFDTNFDNIKTNLIGSANVPITAPQDDLLFGEFNARIDGVNVLKAHSAPNAASHGPLSEIINGDPPANITTKESGSKVKYYKVFKTFIGCAIVGTVPNTGLPSEQVPQPCQILFSGVNSKGGAISQTCSYSGTAKDPAMQECNFGPSFADVVPLIVTVATTLTVPQSTVLFLDNFNHTNYY